MKDWLGLKKVEDQINKAMDFDIFQEEKPRNKTRFPTPKPRYTNKPRPKYEIHNHFHGKKDTEITAGKIASTAKNTIMGLKNIRETIDIKRVQRMEKKLDNLKDQTNREYRKADLMLEIQRQKDELKQMREERRTLQRQLKKDQVQTDES